MRFCRHLFTIAWIFLILSCTIPALAAEQFETAKSAQRSQVSYSYNFQLNYVQYINVPWELPGNTEELRVYITDSSGNQELYVKYGSAVSGSSLDGLEEDADFVSLGSSWDESITINASTDPPLQQGTYYAAVLNFSNETTTGTINFLATVKSGTPTATTLNPSNIGTESVRLNGTINPNGYQTTWYFEYGVTENYGQTTEPQTLEAGSADVSVSVDIDGLVDSPTYHCRLVAENENGISNGNDIYFLTSVWNSNKLYFPHMDTRDPWTTEFGVVNLGDSTVSGTLSLYDDSGDYLGEMDVSVDPYGSKTIDVGAEFGVSAAGYAILQHTSSTDVAGYTAYSQDERFKTAVPAMPGTEIAKETLYAVHVHSDDKWWTGFAFVNTLPVTSTIDINFDDGSSAEVSLPPYGHTALGVRDLFDGVTQPNAQVATITPALGILGLELFSWGNQLAGIPLRESGSQLLQFPYLPKDGNEWVGLAMYNPDNTLVQLTLNTYAADGESTGDLNLLLEPGEKIVGMPDGLEIPSEADWVNITASAPIHGFFLVGDTAGNYLAGTSNVDCLANPGAFMGMDMEGSTEFYLVNTSAQDATIHFEAMDEAGQSIRSTDISIAGHGSLEIGPQELFEDLPDVAGTIRFVDTLLNESIFGVYSKSISSDGKQAFLLPAAGVQN